MSTNEPIARPLARSGHTAVSFGSFVVVWGGYTLQDHVIENYIDTEDVCVYEVETRLWRQISTGGEVPPGTSGACAVAVDQHMFVIGGHSMAGNSNETYCLDLPQRLWKFIPTGDLEEKPSPRDKFTAWHYDNKMYIFGGYGFPLHGYLHENGRYSPDESADFLLRGWNNQLCALDLDTHRWSDINATGSIPSPRAAHATVVTDHRVFLFGGRHNDQRLNDLYELNLVSEQWTSLEVKGDIPCGRSWHSLSAFDNNHMFLYGGYSQDNITLGDCWIFDASSCSWKEMPSRKQNRLWHTAITVSSGEVVIFGGCKNNILNHDINVRHSNDILLFRFTPKSLLKISLDRVVKLHKILAGGFCELPKTLQERMNTRVECALLTEKVRKATTPLVERGQTCVIS